MAHIIFLVGLGYGDEGKGATIDALSARRGGAKLVVRFNGGAQAAHNVVTPDGRHHTFAQFGSGTFAGARTHLSRFMLVNPLSIDAEANHLHSLGVKDPHNLLTVEEEAPITTPFHVLANRLRERLRGDGRHGSCGMGIGETMKDVLAHRYLRAVDLLDFDYTEEILRAMQKDKAFAFKDLPVADLPEWLTDPDLVPRIMYGYRKFVQLVNIVPTSYLRDELQGQGTVLFEGAQGVLLDQSYGFFPHVTHSDTTFNNADKLIEGLNIKPLRIGVTRAHMTRHGAGPFVTETPGWDPGGDHNKQGEWQGGLRYGQLDLVALRYSIGVLGGVDRLVMTHMDQPSELTCVGYIVDGDAHADIPRSPKPDLVYQDMLTQWLGRAQPVYSNSPFSLRTGRTLLGVPFGAFSCGPSRDDFKLDL